MKPLALGMMALLVASTARADGAFPDSLGIFAPAGKRLVLASNFGLLVSEDGASWRWICEAVTGANASLYQAAADGAVLATSLDGLKRGSPDACGWSTSGGTLAGAAVTDVFPDPSDAARVFALGRAQLPDRSYGPLALYRSTDGGKTFGPALKVASPAEDLTGVEVSRSNPDILYVTVSSRGSPLHPSLWRTRDGGASWEQLDLEPALGGRLTRLAAVDPEDPDRLYLRVTDISISASDNPDTLAISEDGGHSWRTPTQPNGSLFKLVYPMTAFLRRTDGTLLLGVGAVGAPHSLYASTDGGHTFAPVKGAPHVRALAERDGVLYAAADDISDGYAVARSADNGATWQPLLRFDGLCGPLQCGTIPSTCAGAWDNLRLTLGIPVNPCGTPTDSPGTTTPGKSCGCGASGAEGGLGAALMGLGLWIARRRR